MKINIYLPDEIGKQAKEKKLPLSRMLREAVCAELLRQEIEQAESENMIRSLYKGVK